MGIMSSANWPPKDIDEAGVMYAYLLDWCEDGDARLEGSSDGGVHTLKLTKSNGQELVWAGRTQANAIVGLAHYLIWHDESPVNCGSHCAGPVLYDEWMSFVGHVATQVLEGLEAS